MHSEILLIEIANKVMLHNNTDITVDEINSIAESKYGVTLTEAETEHIQFLIDRILS